MLCEMHHLLKNALSYISFWESWVENNMALTTTFIGLVTKLF